MNLTEIFCPNIGCPARGQRNKGNIKTPSQAEQRCYCEVCETTFSVKKGTIFYRLKTDPVRVMLVITLLAHGCPVQAIVAAFGFDKRTGRDWWKRAGQHCQQFHEHMVENSQLDLQQVQADEIKAKIQGGTIWIAMAMMVSSRLWLGGVISARRDKALIQALADKVRTIALCRPLLVAVDGLPSYVKAFQRAFRSKLPRYGQPGRCKWRAWSELAIVQGVKKRIPNHFVVNRRIVQGCADQIRALVQSAQGQGGINTAFIERLNAIFRQRRNVLARRTRTLARQPQTLQAGMYVVGSLYNFCTYHKSLVVHQLVLSEHSGTHVDAFNHFAREHVGKSIDTMPLERFYTEGICLNLSHKGLKELIEIADIQSALDEDGLVVKAGDTVLLYTDHYRRYFGTDDWVNGPGISAEAARWFGEQKVAAFGVETRSLGIAGISNVEVHLICGEMGYTHYENLINLHLLIGKGRFRFIGLPLKIRGGTGSPVRAVALLR